MAATVDLDPIFVRALKLLHSKHPDSSNQLKSLVDDAIKQKNNPTAQEVKELKPGKRPIPTPSTSTKSMSSLSSVSETKTSLASRTIDVKHEEKPKIKPVQVTSSGITVLSSSEASSSLLETFEELSSSSMLETVEELSSSSLMTDRGGKRPKVDFQVEKDLDVEKPAETSPDVLTIDLGPGCVVCFSQDVEPRNHLVECQECHSQYHQKCHTPPVSGEDVHDPRLVWYCTPCKKKMKEMASGVKSRLPSSSSGGIQRQTSQSFKRPSTSEPKTPSFTSSPVTTSFVIPALSNQAAAKAAQGGKNPQHAVSQSLKRLQMVKKKAAAKYSNRFTR